MHYPTSILFVCLGNICRSPAAEAVMAAKIANARLPIRLDSAGTANYHTGNPPDTRGIKVGKSLGYDLSTLRARQVSVADFYEFDQIYAMDHSNLANLTKLHNQAMQNADGRTVAKLQLFDPTGKAVADPYYGDEADFVAMFAHLERIADSYLATWHSRI
ncbi:low molecular weight protein-tyrosine-phosphatase [uncultured Moraxella sp.]|uniref:low molecular weight protein-tyrosine-phosphatase n=1 Tax=uncultured Moraxella sp. TaxID=263769 RepID=UPI0025EA815C|nr:low molecular weight protein-tyrosine-phosphatase [uncultured Moraxella sp.]